MARTLTPDWRLRTERCRSETVLDLVQPGLSVLGPGFSHQQLSLPFLNTNPERVEEAEFLVLW